MKRVNELSNHVRSKFGFEVSTQVTVFYIYLDDEMAIMID